MDTHEDTEFTGPSDDSLRKYAGVNTLHFSDGTLDLAEIYDSPLLTNEVPVDPQKLSWAPWMWHYTKFAGGKALEACDHLGEFFASVLGITTPKYQYEITEYNRIQKEIQERDLERSNSFQDAGLQNETSTIGHQNMNMANIQLQCTNTFHSEKC